MTAPGSGDWIGRARVLVADGLRQLRPSVLKDFLARSPAAELDEETGELLLSCTPDAFHLVLRKDGQAIFNMQQECQSGSRRSTADAVKEAVSALTKPQRDLVGTLTLIISDPAIELIDNRFARLRTADKVAVREFAAQHLGINAATYSFLPFGRSSDREMRRGVYLFLGVDRTRDIVNALDTLAPKLTKIVPAVGLIIAAPEDHPFVALDMRLSSSSLLLADPETGMIASREVDVGINLLVSAVAETMAISFKEALDGFRRRDCFAGLDKETVSNQRASTASARALQPALDRLANAIVEAVDYFTFHRIGGAPTRLMLSGGAERLKGLAAWLERVTDLPVANASDPLDQYCKLEESVTLNFLEDAPDGLLQIGKTTYRFGDGHFYPINPELPGPKLAFSTSNILKAKIDIAGLRRGLAQGSNLRWLLGGAAGFAWAAMVWFTVTTGARDLVAANQMFGAALVQDGSMRTALAQRQRASIPDDGSNRLLWSDKLLAISRALPSEIQLTKVEVLPSGDQKGGQRLSLEGEIATNNRGKMGQASEFIDRLNADKDFMRDFRAVTFDGETAGQTGDSGVINVSFSVWFDPARRRDLAVAGEKDGRP